jgi:hypothetical protein
MSACIGKLYQFFGIPLPGTAILYMEMGAQESMQT